MEFSITTDVYDCNGPIGSRLKVFRGAGFRYIHWCERWAEDYMYGPEEVESIARACEGAGITFMDTHNAACETASIDHPDEAIRAGGVRLLRNRLFLTRSLGGDCLVLHPPRWAEGEEAQPRIEAFTRSLREVEPACRSAGVRLAVENMARARFNEPFGRLFEEFEADFLGFCYDSGHANIAGQLDLVERFGRRLFALHLHDNRGQRDEHALPGEGTVDWNYLVKVLRRLDYRRPVNLEVSAASMPGTAPAEFVRLAYQRVEALFR